MNMKTELHWGQVTWRSPSGTLSAGIWREKLQDGQEMVSMLILSDPPDTPDWIRNLAMFYPFPFPAGRVSSIGHGVFKPTGFQH